MKILYVEDNDDNIYMLKTGFREPDLPSSLQLTGRRALPWRPPSSLTSFLWTSRCPT